MREGDSLNTGWTNWRKVSSFTRLNMHESRCWGCYAIAGSKLFHKFTKWRGYHYTGYNLSDHHIDKGSLRQMVEIGFFPSQIYPRWSWIGQGSTSRITSASIIIACLTRSAIAECDISQSYDQKEHAHAGEHSQMTSLTQVWCTMQRW